MLSNQKLIHINLKVEIDIFLKAYRNNRHSKNKSIKIES